LKKIGGNFMEKKNTICHLCSACCPVIIYLKNNKIIRVERKSNNKTIENYSCPKIKAATQIIYSPDRLKKPMIKKKRNGKSFWQEVSWETALNNISKKLNLLKNEYGPESICWLRGQASDWGAVWHYTNRLMNVFGSPNTIGNGSVCHAARNANHVFTYGAMTSPDYINSNCIIVWGRNDRDSKPSLYEEIVHSKEKGTKIIVIDPVKTKLASMADIWLQIKPGYDGRLAMSMIHVIISENLYDQDFVRDWTIGFDKLKDIASHYVPEKIANAMWLNPEEIRKSARLYAKIKPACIGDGNGIDMHLNVSQTSRQMPVTGIPK
jgi:anaerobic selenocysteine-containing dehydrogenase